MKKRDLQNEKLNRLRRALLAATRAPDEELEKIVAAPKLFDGVTARIKAERQRERQLKINFAARQNPFAWNRQKTSAALIVLLFFSFGAALGLNFLTKDDSSPTLAEQIIVPQIQFPDAPVEILKSVEAFAASPAIVKTKDSERKNRAVFRKADFKNESDALPKRAARRMNPAAVKRQTENEPEGEFYALASAGNSPAGEAGEDLRIIRAELSRSSLFALGVNLPIENESEKIKTDLLVGADGVAKAIRFVK
ncbi:MAG TPA: hypothetical protein VK400_01245 [Pyrinomonadaceae bacterium]|nr:hypothetical protein [Pyrinomonadaceae bacterium]